jgi:hypothetical protein
MIFFSPVLRAKSEAIVELAGPQRGTDEAHNNSAKDLLDIRISTFQSGHVNAREHRA